MCIIGECTSATLGPRRTTGSATRRSDAVAQRFALCGSQSGSSTAPDGSASAFRAQGAMRCDVHARTARRFMPAQRGGSCPHSERRVTAEPVNGSAPRRADVRQGPCGGDGGRAGGRAGRRAKDWNSRAGRVWCRRRCCRRTGRDPANFRRCHTCCWLGRHCRSRIRCLSCSYSCRRRLHRHTARNPRSSRPAS